jgi:hypothetical protein
MVACFGEPLSTPNSGSTPPQELALLGSSRSLRIFSTVGGCAGLFGYLLNAVSELARQSCPSATELATGGQEMLPRLSWHPGDR